MANPLPLMTPRQHASVEVPTDRGEDREGVHLVRADQIALEAVDYLDEPLIPLRVVTLVVGIDGVGKSTVLFHKAGRASRGLLQGAHAGHPVDVVVASSEDHPASVIAPRLMAAGADLSRIHIVKVRREGLEGEITFPDDMDDVADRVLSVNARLLIVDPLVAHLHTRIDSHKAQHVRRALAPLARLAEEGHLAVAAVVHFNGSAAADVRGRISGSKALRDLARSVLVCGEDPHDETRNILVQDKNSFGPKAKTGQAYRIVPRDVEHQGSSFATSGVVWLGNVEIDGRGLLLDPRKSEHIDNPTDRQLGRDVILDALEGNDRQWKDLLELLLAEGISQSSAKRARDDLVRRGLIDKRKDGASGGWWWHRRIQVNQVVHAVETGQVGQDGQIGGSG